MDKTDINDNSLTMSQKLDADLMNSGFYQKEEEGSNTSYPEVYTVVIGGIRPLNNITPQDEKDSHDILNRLMFETWGFSEDLLDYLEKGKKMNQDPHKFNGLEFPYNESSHTIMESKNDSLKIPVSKDTKPKTVIEQLSRNLSTEKSIHEFESIAYNPFDTIFMIEGILVRYNEQSYTDEAPFFEIRQEEDNDPSTIYGPFSQVSNGIYEALNELGFLRTDEDLLDDDIGKIVFTKDIINNY